MPEKSLKQILDSVNIKYGNPKFLKEDITHILRILFVLKFKALKVSKNRLISPLSLAVCIT